MEEEKKIEEEVKEEVEVSMNPEDYEGQTTVEELDVRECEVVDGGDEVEATDKVAE